VQTTHPNLKTSTQTTASFLSKGSTLHSIKI
jgi:hypothetical protein